MGKFVWCRPLQQSKKKQLSAEERSQDVLFGPMKADADQIVQHICSCLFFCADFSFSLEVLISQFRKYMLKRSAVSNWILQLEMLEFRREKVRMFLVGGETQHHTRGETQHHTKEGWESEAK